jgi:hypothetical protein
MALEGAVDYRRTDLAGGAETRAWPVTLSLVASPIPVAYLLAGIGWYNLTLEVPSAFSTVEETQSRFGYHVGAGVRAPVLPDLSFVGDLRYGYVDYEFDQFAEAVAGFDGGDYVSLNLGVMLAIPGGA